MAGAPVSDPWSAAFGAVASVAKPAPAGPSNAISTGSTNAGTIDNSGWNVTFGAGSSITSDRDQTAPANIGQAVGQLTQYAPYLAVGAVVLFILKRRRK